MVGVNFYLIFEVFSLITFAHSGSDTVSFDILWTPLVFGKAFLFNKELDKLIDGSYGRFSIVVCFSFTNVISTGKISED